ncbi:MAG TPA: RNA-binding cell elongation regulator Jag/EloR [Gaiellaceae bacterium]|nr:RNA-binding cell elongation regulator Jag/EloR [Gaiellaceae bacterium]
MGEPVEVDATGETVGEAKWNALRELERMYPGLDKAAVSFEILSEGERGLLGVGYAPARVLATAPAGAFAVAEPSELGAAAADARELVERITAALGVECRIDVSEADDTITVSCTGRDLGVLIGRHGQTIDAVQYLANAIAFRAHGDGRKEVVVDAAGYQARRRELLESLAQRTAERVRRSGEAVALEPMSATERKIVHTRLADAEGIETSSEGSEPTRYVVVRPA